MKLLWKATLVLLGLALLLKAVRAAIDAAQDFISQTSDAVQSFFTETIRVVPGLIIIGVVAVLVPPAVPAGLALRLRPPARTVTDSQAVNEMTLPTLTRHAAGPNPLDTARNLCQKYICLSIQ